MKNKVLVIDNYDSFTYNLVHYMEDLDFDVTVVRNDEFSMDFIENFDKILISPGPGIPDEAGQTKELIKRFYSKKCHGSLPRPPSNWRSFWWKT